MMCHLCSRLKNILVRIECVITEGGVAAFLSRGRNSRKYQLKTDAVCVGCVHDLFRKAFILSKDMKGEALRLVCLMVKIFHP